MLARIGHAGAAGAVKGRTGDGRKRIKRAIEAASAVKWRRGDERSLDEQCIAAAGAVKQHTGDERKRVKRAAAGAVKWRMGDWASAIKLRVCRVLWGPRKGKIQDSGGAQTLTSITGGPRSVRMSGYTQTYTSVHGRPRSVGVPS